jgi:antitoxin ParD1/3/4
VWPDPRQLRHRLTYASITTATLLNKRGLSTILPERASLSINHSSQIGGRIFSYSLLPSRAEGDIPNVVKLSITLTSEMAGMVKQAVRSGEYASSSEVIREALRLWRDHQQARAQEIEALRRAWDEGIASGPSTRTVAEIMAEGRARLEKQG